MFSVKHNFTASPEFRHQDTSNGRNGSMRRVLGKALQRSEDMFKYIDEAVGPYLDLQNTTNHRYMGRSFRHFVGLGSTIWYHEAI